MENTRFYVKLMDQSQSGPHTLDDLAFMEIKADTLISNNKGISWHRACEFKDLEWMFELDNQFQSKPSSVSGYTQHAGLKGQPLKKTFLFHKKTKRSMIIVGFTFIVLAMTYAFWPAEKNLVSQNDRAVSASQMEYTAMKDLSTVETFLEVHAIPEKHFWSGKWKIEGKISNHSLLQSYKNPELLVKCYNRKKELISQKTVHLKNTLAPDTDTRFQFTLERIPGSKTLEIVLTDAEPLPLFAQYHE